MLKRVLGLAVLFVSVAAPAFAQVVPRTFEVGGVTGVLVTTQTMRPGGVDDPAADVDLTAITVGLDGTFYFTERVGLGALVTYQSVSFGPANEDKVKFSGGLFGPLAKIRLSIGPRADVVLSGGAGLARMTSQVGDAADTESKTDGLFWLGGAGLSFFLAENASFDVGARYQSSTIKFDDAGDDLKSAGFLVAIGFSVYIK